MTHEEKALSYYKEGYHCSQAVLAAHADELGLTEEHALKIAHCFNGGMRQGVVCGACSGALMVLGIKYGQYRKGDTGSDELANKKAQEFMEKFKNINSSFMCNELLKRDENACANMIVSAIRIIEEM